MKIVRTEVLIDAGKFSASGKWKKIRNDIVQTIESMDWPPGSGSFTIYRERGKEHENGVKPIRDMFVSKIKDKGWGLETELDIAARIKPGRIDATYKVGRKYFAVEWETGNISSSHRAVNKMALGILRGVLIGGALVLPSRRLYPYLTDRVGNLDELEPYFPLWKALECKKGILIIFAVEHDKTSSHVPRIPKGTDGRALV